jgi:hypothetical protein
MLGPSCDQDCVLILAGMIDGAASGVTLLIDRKKEIRRIRMLPICGGFHSSTERGAVWAG